MEIHYLRTPAHLMAKPFSFTHRGRKRIPQDALPEVMQGIADLDCNLKTLERKSITPNERLIETFGLAKEEINILRGHLGMPIIPEEIMKILVLPPEEFDELHARYSGDKSEKGSLGFTSMFLPILLKHSPELPDYFVGSSAFHELVHKFLALHVVTFDRKKHGGKAETVVFEQPRSGSVVFRRNPAAEDNEAELESPVQVGQLLRELTAYQLELYFIDLLFENTDLYGDEVREREEKLSKFLGDTQSNGVILVISDKNDGAHIQLALDSDKIHFTKNGDLNDALFPAQIADELDYLCAEGEEKFTSLLIKSQLNLTLQQRLKQLIDAKMGKGFYSRLRRAGFWDHIAILQEIQRVAYPNPEFWLPSTKP